MSVVSRTFPYPVVSIGGTDYKDTVFENEVTCSFELVDGVSHPQLTWRVSVSNPVLDGLFAAGQIKFVLDVLAKETLTRQSFEVQPSGSKLFAAGDLYGTVQVTPYLIASSTIPDFRPTGLNLEYGDSTFEIGNGDVLGIGDTFIFEIVPDTTALPDEMVVKLSEDVDKDTYEIILTDSTIIVFAGKDVKEYWDRVHENPEQKSYLYQSIYKDCVLVALKKIVDEDSDSQWAKSLKANLEARGLTISAEPSENELNVIALKLMAPRGIQKTLGRLRNL